MKWILDSDRPIYTQLVEQITEQIVSGMYKCGDKLPSVRDLATEAAVNPNTMQKALSELERKGLVFTQRTTGRFITEDKNMIEQVKTQIATEQIVAFYTKMKQLGLNNNEIIELTKTTLKEMNQ